MSIMSELGGTLAEPSLKNIDVRLQSFPYPPYYRYDVKYITTGLQNVLPFMIVVSFWFVATNIWGDIVMEKEKKLKVSIPCRSCFLALNGLTTRLLGYWCSTARINCFDVLVYSYCRQYQQCKWTVLTRNIYLAVILTVTGKISNLFTENHYHSYNYQPAGYPLKCYCA